MSDINVTVTNAGAAQVSVPNGSTVNTTVGNGGAVNVAIGTISPGNASVVSGTVTIGKTTTLAAGSNATVVNNGTAFAAVLDFGIPTGAAGPTGATGPAGKDGVTPAFSIGTVSTLAAGSSANVTLTSANNGANVTLDFGIPRGDPGTGGGSSVSLSDATPSALGTASPGTSSLASRADHVHALPALVASLNTLTGPLTLAAGTGVTITPSGSTLTIASTASAPLANDLPQPLGIAAVGASTDAAREDHVHAMPTAADVGALDENSIVDGGNYIGYIPQNTITIVTQPTAQTASNGAASFSVAATSTPGGTLSYQWEKQDGGFGDYNAISGATSATLSLTGLLNTVDDGDRYRVVVSATNAVSVTSQSALLTVPANTITITTQPSNQTASGGAATFTVAATVAPSGTPSYQWQRSDDAGVSWANVAGATSATLALTGLTVEADGDSQFRVVVSATNAASVTSNAATLTVQSNNTITVTSQPTNQTASGGAATFTAAATVAPSGTPTYQWQKADYETAGGYWSAGAMPAALSWSAIAYSDYDERFVALAVNHSSAYYSDNGTTWTQRPLVSGSPWSGIAFTLYGGYPRFVAIGGSQVATSAEGIFWNESSIPWDYGWSSIAAANGTFVMVGGGTSAASSTDGGNTWTLRTLPANSTWKSVTAREYDGASVSRLFVAVSGSFSTKAATSPDGVTWTARTLPQSRNWISVAYGGGRFVAIAKDSTTAATSSDGVTWTERTLPSQSAWQNVSYGNGRFVAVSGDGCATSEDGIVWTTRSLPAGSWVTRVAYGGGKFLGVGAGSSVLATSTAGSGPFANIPGATSSTLALTGLTASNDQDQYRAVVSATNAAPVTSSAATLTVGSTPTPTITITQQPANQTASGGAASFSVAATVSPSGTPTYQWQRSDASMAGATWTQRTLPSSPSTNWRQVGYGGGTFVAVGWGTSSSATSTDGITWTQRTMPSSGDWYGVAYGNQTFVALKDNSDTAATSPDGITWTQRTLPGYADWRSVAFGNGRFVAVASTPSLTIAATSQDGITWTQTAMPVGANWSSVAYGNGRFVAVAWATAIAATSTDGITWTQRTMPVSAYWRCVTYGNGVFVAVSQSTVAATSTDGITWTQRTMPSFGYWEAVAYGNGAFVSVAVDGGSLAASSANGINWTAQTMPSGTNWSGVAYGKGLFVAVANNMAATSNDVTTTAFANISGATSSTLALTGLTIDNDQDQYRAVVSAANAAPVTSNAATLTVP